MDLGALSDAQVAELTYLRPNIKDFTLDDNLPPWNHLPRTTHVRRSTRNGLGGLDVLPVELLQLMLLQLDLTTFTRFRLVNRRAAQIADSVPQYEDLTKHACNVLRGVTSTEAGAWVTVNALHEVLCTAECQTCGDFGGYVYLLTCKRVCFLCFTEAKDYLPLLQSHATRKFGVGRDILKSLPHMRSIQGVFSPNQRKCNETHTLVDYRSAYLAGIEYHGSSSALEAYVEGVHARKLEEYDQRRSHATASALGPSTQRVRRPVSEDQFDGKSGNPKRFMAICRLPWLDKSSRRLEWGFHCIGCQKSYQTRQLHFRRKFNRKSFQEHLERHGKIENRHHMLE